jgi:GNAT superfamily N-acetyltransferase
MRVSFERADLDALAGLWNEFYAEPYHIDGEIMRLNTIDCPVFDWGASAVEVQDGKPIGFAIFKRSANPLLFKGPDPDQAHLSAVAYSEADAGVDLLAEAKKILRNRGIYRLIFGQDARHFFPGCPEDCANLSSFLMVEGFQEGNPVHDLERDLSDYSPPEGVLNALNSASAEVRPLEESDLDALSFFLHREFRGRWEHDTLDKISREGRSDFVHGLFIGDSLEGFTVTQDSSHTVPVAGGVWRQSLGDHWGTLGPIGTSRRLRGKGLGHALLASALLGLKEKGVRKCLIDWTTLVDFYGKHGFTPTRTYRSRSLDLEVG